jgi:RHS repeat-associated protein
MGGAGYILDDQGTTYDAVADTVEARTISTMQTQGFTFTSLSRYIGLDMGPDHKQICWSWAGTDSNGDPFSSSCDFWLEVGTASVCPSGYALTVVSGQEHCVASNINLRQCSTEPKPDKNRGCNGAMEGNPCNLGTGNKFQIEWDYPGVAGSPLKYGRYYNSDSSTPRGAHHNRWLGTYDRYIVFSWDAGLASVHLGPAHLYAHRQDGRILAYNAGSTITPKDPSTIEKLSQIDPVTWELTMPDGSIEVYKLASTNNIYTDHAHLDSIRFADGQKLTLTYSSGRLSTVSDEFGHKLTFTFDVANNRISKFTDPANKNYTYAYTSGYMTKVTYPDSKFRLYTYGGGSTAGLLTSIIDENGATYASWTYDTATRRALSSQHAGGADAVTFAYNSNGTVTATDSLGSSRTYTLSLIDGALMPESRATGAMSESFTYDAYGLLSSKTDKRGVVASYTHDSRGLETSRTEADGTSVARTITTQWHATLHKPTLVTEPGRTTAYTYDANGNALTRTVSDTATSQSRVWTYTYDSNNRLLTENGPRTDVTDLTTYTYYTCTTGGRCGRLQTIKNALNQITTFNTYNAHGQPLTITDPNGVVTTLTYDFMTRLTSVLRAGETTTITYHPTGLVQRVTLPDTSYVEYTYDNAHRLTQVADGQGNRIAYTLDSRGNRTAESAYDPSNALSRTRTRVFNAVNQLWKELTAAGSVAQTTEVAYDGEDNLVAVDSPLGRSSSYVYDEIGRVEEITDSASGITHLEYDDNDRVTSVIDPKSLVTSYSYSGFGDLLQQVSPDDGTTTSTYDLAGNLATRLDARGELASYSYDSLNRITQIAYGDQTWGFTYDAGANGKGHLTQVSDASGSTTWTYTASGRVASRTQAMGSVSKAVGYGYTGGRLTTITLPSGQVVTYTYTNGRIASVSVGGTTVLSSVLYEPFGPARQWTWGNATLAVRTHDQDGNPTQIDSVGLQTYGYDDALRITSITDAANSNLSQTYGYDLLDRLTSATTLSGSQGWTYDPNGSRVTQTGSAGSTHTISSSSNRVASISGALTRSYSYDSGGNVLSDGASIFVYNDANRMSSATKSGVATTYAYNALGQRVSKTSGGVSRYFVYDESGRLIGEYNSAGAMIQETVWLEDTPVATLRPNGPGVSVFYIHSDHLNTPRRVSRPTDNVIVWRWDSDPFGTQPATEDPDGDSSTFSYNLRFAGQYFDSETGLHYNYFRDYDPATGRYVQSDPIGLAGGLHTYAYVNSSPVSFIDPEGLQQVPARILQHNRWNEPWRQARREFRGEDFDPGNLPPGVYPTPKPWCRIECPDEGGVCKPTPQNGIPVPGKSGCYQVCVDGPFVSDASSPRPSPPPENRGPRDMTRGDWWDLFELVRTLRR